MFTLGQSYRWDVEWHSGASRAGDSGLIDEFRFDGVNLYVGELFDKGGYKRNNSLTEQLIMANVEFWVSIYTNLTNAIYKGIRTLSKIISDYNFSWA